MLNDENLMDECDFSLLNLKTCFQAVANRKIIPNLMSPKSFTDNVQLVVNSELRQTHESASSIVSSYFGCGESCSHRLLLSILSAIHDIFDSNEAREIHVSNASFEKSQACKTGVSSIDAKLTLTSNSEAKEYVSKMPMEDWFHEARKLLSSNDIVILLINCIKQKCKFTSFLAKKAFVIGIQRKHIEVSYALNKLEQEWATAFYQNVSFLEILRDLLSQKLCGDREVMKKTFIFLQRLDAQVFRQRIHETECKDSRHITYLYEYLSLIHKATKYAMNSSSDVNHESNGHIVCSMATELLVSHIDKLLSFPLSLGGHLICSNCLRIFNILLDLKFIERTSSSPAPLVKFSEHLAKEALKILRIMCEMGFFSVKNFIGKAITPELQNSVSPLMRTFIVVVLKANAVIWKENKEPSETVAKVLSQFLLEIGCLAGETDSWLPKVFGDQDDQWIASLMSLMVIHQEGSSRLQKLQQRHPHQAKEGIDVSLTQLLPVICPHIFFLQFVQFIDYDHIVLADFLSSPETAFLPYFIQYLHIVADDWSTFKTVIFDCEKTKFMETNLFVSDVQSKVSDNCECERNVKKSLVSSSQESDRKYARCQLQNHSCEVEQSHGDHHTHPNALLKDVPESTSPHSDRHRGEPYVCRNPEQQSTRYPLRCTCYSNKDIAPQSQSDLFMKTNTNDSLKLVSYSDSESDEDTLDKKELETTIQSKKRPLSITSGGEEKNSDNETESYCSDNNTSSDIEEGVSKDHNEFDVEIAKCDGKLVHVMSLFIRLRLHIERLEENNIFPYPVKPLLLALEHCEELYEN